MSSPNLIALLQLADPTLPIGGFAHSAGLETYVQLGLVKDKATAKDFIVAQLEQNILYTDAALVSLAFTATEKGDAAAMVALSDLCNAVKMPREVREASQKLGTRLLKIFMPLCNSAFAEQYKLAVKHGGAAPHYPIVFGLFAALLGLSKEDCLTGFFYNCAAGLVTNSVKLIPLGQQDGQQILFSIHPLINGLVARSIDPDRDLIGLCCAGFDIRCMQHEQLYSRLYMS
jgi:urease accessory protein